MKARIFKGSVMAVAACAAGQAGAVSFTQGDATIDINGTINGFYAHRSVEANGVETNNSELTNGLLPGWINFVFTTKVDGLDIKAHVGFAPGINDKSDVVGLPSDPSCGADVGCDSPFSQIDTRNLYFQFGTNDWGTVKLGRDIGLFGQKIIMHLHGGAMPAFMARHPHWARRVLRRAAAVVVPSAFLRAALAKFRDDVRVIPNAVDVAAYPYRHRADLRPRLFWMRTFHDVYNPELAIRAFARVRRAFPDATLVMAGQDKGTRLRAQQSCPALPKEPD